MSLIILTKSPSAGFFSQEVYRGVIKKLLNKNRGPEAVLRSLLRGLNELKYPYLINPKIAEIKTGDTVFVNGSIVALQWAIKEKKAGKFKKLVAGPNLVVGPDDFNGIINTPEIDLILQPSDWVRDFYLSISPFLADKIKVWPAGVALPENLNETDRVGAVVYFKNCSDDKLPGHILKELKNLPIKIDVLTYGHFKQKDYHRLLAGAKFMVYVSESESQGLALQEAWARNVPTLVWNGGSCRFEHYRWRDPVISAPYLSARSGMFFSGTDDFKKRLQIFMDSLDNFSARDYVRENLIDRKCAENFIKLIQPN
ncbi:MAG: hypothetical protein PHD72_00995 [Patescibacteria group bacterium]|nr:hypothetical protein [Patescibacteria group bacterium]